MQQKHPLIVKYLPLLKNLTGLFKLITLRASDVGPFNGVNLDRYI